MLNWYRAAQAHALASGRHYCVPDDFKGLAAACDIVVASDDAVFGTPEIDVGLWPFMVTVPLCRSMPKEGVNPLVNGSRSA